MLELNKQLKDTAFDHKKEDLQKEIEKTDHEIDDNVYELYRLTNEERQLIEAAM